MTDRYFVDERIGYIAVMDREKQSHWLAFSLLDKSKPTPVRVWMGKWQKAPLGGWYIDNFSRIAATRLCAELNKNGPKIDLKELPVEEDHY